MVLANRNLIQYLKNVLVLDRKQRADDVEWNSGYHEFLISSLHNTVLSTKLSNYFKNSGNIGIKLLTDKERAVSPINRFNEKIATMDVVNCFSIHCTYQIWPPVIIICSQTSNEKDITKTNDWF